MTGVTRARTMLGALWLTSPADAARRVLSALSLSGTVKGAAAELGVSRRTLTRWMRERPELKDWRAAAQ